MATSIKSTGKCIFCGKEFSKQTMSRHLATHLQQKVTESKPGKSFHLKIETAPRWGSTPYFLHLWANGKVPIHDVDDFLRAIWLECCGHMSSFTNKAAKKTRGLWHFFEAQTLLSQGKRKEYEELMEDANGEIPMSKKLKDTLHKDMKIDYQYDFGSTTELLITVVGEYPVAATKSLVLLSRNEPPDQKCSMCGEKGARVVCTVCISKEDAFFCKTCAKKHAKTCSDFDDYASMSVVNSPRMGVCGYEGGTIDTKRDQPAADVK